ncbi:protein STPG3 [Phyllostomus discolor]|uniref:Protein STPG3 n=1 Tax=Phyllostomus discolor TaxID=89673 RepID=A0A7E6DHH1_9CHIR|nr:protein STPG3 [Phyllostomus discolor]
MNFDQKAVKFLANFYINGGKHWTHGPLRLKSLVPAQPLRGRGEGGGAAQGGRRQCGWTQAVLSCRPKDAVWRCPGVGAAWEMWPPAVVLESPEGLRMRRGPFQESRQNCTRGLKELCEWGSPVRSGEAGQRREGPRERTQEPSLLPLRAGATPPHRHRPGRPRPRQVRCARRFGARILPAPPLQHRPQAPRPRCVLLPASRPPPGLPSPGSGAAPPACPPQRHCPPAEGGGRRAWQTVWLQSDSPFTQKVDFCWEQKWPSPADYRPLSGPAFPAFSFGAPRPASKTRDARARPALPRARGAGPRARPLSQLPSPSTYDILPGCRLRGPRSPAFTMSRSPAFASWLSSSHTPGPAAYYVEDCYNSRFPSAPGVVIQGVRRPKRHDTGPFCAL